MTFFNSNQFSEPIQDQNLPNIEEKEPRVLFAMRFLREVLIPAITQGLILNSDTISVLYSKFQNSNPGLGSDCSLENIWGIAWERDIKNLETANRLEQQPADSYAWGTAVELLEEIIFKDEIGNMNDDEDEIPDTESLKQL